MKEEQTAGIRSKGSPSTRSLRVYQVFAESKWKLCKVSAPYPTVD